jgi:hypothetical protein
LLNADGLRLAGGENKMMEGKIYMPVIFSDKLVNENSYSQRDSELHDGDNGQHPA